MPKILGVKFDNVTLKEATQIALDFLEQKGQHQIVTPNPEILLTAAKNPKFKKILNQASLSIPDGAGIIWAAKRQKTPLKQRVTGTDLMAEICKSTNHPIFLLGAAPGIAKKTAEKLQLNPEFTESLSPEKKHESQIIAKINHSKAKILFVAFGAPAQELWIARNLPKMPYIKVAVGIGGAFDFLSGTRPRAPKILQDLGLEWLYRLINQPSRIKRILNATIKFPIKCLTEKD